MNHCRLQTTCRFTMLAALLFAASPLQAQTVRYVNDDATPGGDGTSWPTAYRTLQGALADARNSGGAVTQIWVAQGAYRPSLYENGADYSSDRTRTFELVNGVAVYGGFAVGESSLGQRDVDSNATILSGDLEVNNPPDCGGTSGYNSYHVVTALGTSPSARLDGFTISGGLPGGSGNYIYGGAIYIENASPKIVRCKMVCNGCPVVYVTGGGNPILSHCVVQGSCNNWVILHTGTGGNGMKPTGTCIKLLRQSYL